MSLARKRPASLTLPTRLLQLHRRNPKRLTFATAPSASSWSGASSAENRPSWSPEWKRLGLGAQLVDTPRFPPNLFFVQMGFGVDQHGENNNATKAAVRAVRNAVEFNSIPGVISHLPGGRANMLVHVKLGVPAIASAPMSDSCDENNTNALPIPLDHLEVAKVFPYGKLLPLEVVIGGLSFHTGRVVEELGDKDDVGICVAACVSIGYGQDDDGSTRHHKTYNTKDDY